MSFAQTLLRGEQGGAGKSGGVGDEGDAAPWDVAQGLRGRVAALSTGAQAVLGAPAVVGRRAAVALLVATTGRPEDEALDALEEAARARLLDAEGHGAYRFVHDLVREAVLSGLGPARRATLHRRIAAALEAGAGAGTGELPVEELAYHYSRAGDAFDEQAAAYLERAGDRALAGYATEAAEGYYRATVARLDHLERAADAARAREKLGETLRMRGRFDEALAALDGALAAYRAAGDGLALARVTALVGHAHMDRGTLDEGTARVLETLGYLQEGGLTQGLAALYITLGLLFFGSGRYQEQLVAAEMAAEMAGAAGDEGRAIRAESTRGHALLLLGRIDEGIAAMEGIIPRIEAVGDLDCLTGNLGNLAAAYMWRGEFGRAAAYIASSDEAAERLGSALLRTIARLRRAILRMFEGDWIAACADLDWIAALDEQIDGTWVFAYPVLALGTLRFLEGDWEGAGRYLGEAVAAAGRTGDMEVLRWARLRLAERDLLSGRREAIADIPAQLAPLLDRPASGEDARELDVSALLPRLAWARLELGDTDRAAALAEEGVARAGAQGHRIALADALWVRGMVETRRGRWDEAVAALDEGLDVARALPYPYAEARTLEAYGRMRLAQGESGPARERLRAALALFERLGARTDAARVGAAIAEL